MSERAVKVLVGLYRGCPGRVVEEHEVDGRKSVLVEFISGYRVRFSADEVIPIQER